MYGTIRFTDKEHFHSEQAVYQALPVPGAKRLLVGDACLEGFYGFGVAVTPASCYELNQMEAGERERLLRHIYGKEGLGLSVCRICIGSSDYSPEIYSYDDVAFDRELVHFSVKRDEAYIIPMLKEILQINPELYILASPWSPPYWMKTGGSMCGGYMRSEFVDCYAEYIIKFIQAYAGYGIRISAVTPQNEPNTQQSGRMPACIWHPEIEADFIKVLRNKISEQDLDVKIWMYDHNFNDTQRVIWSLETCEGLLEACDGVAFHYYEGTIEQTREVKERFPELKLHFTEGGPRLTENYDTDWCKWGLMAIKALKAGYQSFIGWNLMLNEMGGPNVGPFIGICGGLVTRDTRNGELRYSGQYKAFTHLAPYITPESRLRPVSVGASCNINMSQYPKQDRDIEGVLIENPDGRRIAVLVNPNEYGMQIQMEINNALWYAELYPDSIATILVDDLSGTEHQTE